MPPTVLARVLALPTLCLAAALAAVTLPGSANAVPADVGLGTAGSYAVLAGSTVTNTGPTTVSGDVGLSPGSAVTGFPPGLVSDGVIHAADASAAQAQGDLTGAYGEAAGLRPDVDVTGQDLGGLTLAAGTYTAASSMAVTGTVTLDAEGDPDAVFVLQAGSTLGTGPNSSVALVDGAQACHVYWQVGSSATLATGTRFAGTVLALTDIVAQRGARIEGRLLARNGQVTLDTNVITRPGCAAPTPTSPPVSSSPPVTSTPPVTQSPSVTPSSATAAPSTTTAPTDSASVTVTSSPGGPDGTGTPAPTAAGTDTPTAPDTGTSTGTSTGTGTDTATGTATSAAPTGTDTATSTATSTAGAVVPRGFPATGRPVAATTLAPTPARTPWLVVAMGLLACAGLTTAHGLRRPAGSRGNR